MEQRRHDARSQPSHATRLLPSIQELDAVPLMLEGPRERERLPLPSLHSSLVVELGPLLLLVRERYRHDSSSIICACAFSSQYVMPISRYIVVAVVRCSCTCSRWPVR